MQKITLNSFALYKKKEETPNYIQNCLMEKTLILER